MSKRSVSLLLEDMIEAVETIFRYADGYTFERFHADQRTVDAVVRNLMILGEVAAKMPPDARIRFPEIEWDRIAKTRHRLVHEYFSVDTGIVWRIVQIHLPALLPTLQQARAASDRSD